MTDAHTAPPVDVRPLWDKTCHCIRVCMDVPERGTYESDASYSERYTDAIRNAYNSGNDYTYLADCPDCCGGETLESAHPRTPELSLSATRSSSQFVPVAVGELYGPCVCKACGGEAWTIWVTPQDKRLFSFVEIFKSIGTARCEKCGPPDTANSNL